MKSAICYVLSVLCLTVSQHSDGLGFGIALALGVLFGAVPVYYGTLWELLRREQLEGQR